MPEPSIKKSPIQQKLVQDIKVKAYKPDEAAKTIKVFNDAVKDHELTLKERGAILDGLKVPKEQQTRVINDPMAFASLVSAFGDNKVVQKELSSGFFGGMSYPAAKLSSDVLNIMGCPNGEQQVTKFVK